MTTTNGSDPMKLPTEKDLSRALGIPTERAEVPEMVERTIEGAFQFACNAFLRANKKGERNGKRFFDAANAIEAAWPEIIERYRIQIGCNEKAPEEP